MACSKPIQMCKIYSKLILITLKARHNTGSKNGVNNIPNFVLNAFYEVLDPKDTLFGYGVNIDYDGSLFLVILISIIISYKFSYF